VLRIINLFLVITILINAFYLTNQRFAARQFYMRLAQLQKQADGLNKEYTRLQLEEGTFSSDLAIQDYAKHDLGLIQADKQHVVELK
jgi:cell division protein FtsL